MSPFCHYRENSNPVFLVYPGFRLALAIASLTAMTASFGANFGTLPDVEVINHLKNVTLGRIYLAMQMGYESFFDHAWSLLFMG
jgi:hypothetical protein